MIRKIFWVFSLFAMVSVGTLLLQTTSSAQVENPQEGSIGLEGKIPADPPKTAASITFPRNGDVLRDMPVTVTGICPTGLLVKLYKNNVFAGAAQCVNGTFSIKIDLFYGSNELVARVYDDLDQKGPDSNKVTVTYPFDQFSAPNRVSLTSNFAKRGANPGQTLTWPIVISGGSGPYAISIDWGDGSETTLMSLEFAGEFSIKHIYEQAGIYNILVRATDRNGEVAYLQLVGVANGEIGQGNEGEDGEGSTVRTIIRILWWPAAICIPLILLAFWLGRKHELKTIRKKLEQR